MNSELTVEPFDVIREDLIYNKVNSRFAKPGESLPETEFEEGFISADREAITADVRRPRSNVILCYNFASPIIPSILWTLWKLIGFHRYAIEVE